MSVYEEEVRFERPLQVFVTSDDVPESPRTVLTDEERIVYTEQLRQELSKGSVATRPMQDHAITNILRHFPDWAYRTEVINGRSASVLERQGLDSGIDLVPPSPAVPRRRVYRTASMLSIVTKHVIGDDIRYALGIEQQCVDTANSLHMRLTKPYRQQARRFKETAARLVAGDKVFEPIERSILTKLTQYQHQSHIASRLGITGTSVSRLMAGMRDKTGALTDTDLMLFAVATDLAHIDHIEQGKTAVITGIYRQTLEDRYSNDPARRLAINQLGAGALHSRNHRAYKMAGLQSDHELVLCGIRDGLVPLPDVGSGFDASESAS